jgi:hypothetical protein
LWQRQVLRCSAAMAGSENFCFFFFTRQFQRENENKTEIKEAGFETCFPVLFVGKLLPGNVNSLQQQEQH